ncbi:MAG TPA: hypothetical protein VFQ88_09515 [Nevskiaceae bacterium]|nr:hypothetical protein [Nevskiaceae bacterium]
MSKHFTFSLFGLALIVFVAYVLVAGTPLERINRVCSPITWVGKSFTALGDIAGHGVGGTLHHGASNTLQGCRFIVFRTFYSAEYQRLEAARAKHAKAPAAPAATHDAPPVDPSHAPAQ